MLKARILGTGSYLPEKIWTNKDLEAFCDTSDEWIRQRTGIEQRHVAPDEHGVTDLAIGAAQMALQNAEVAPSEVDAIIFCTVTPDQLLPASGSLLQKRLGASNAAAFDLNAACSGFIYGLATADAYIRSGLFKTVLLVGAGMQTNRRPWENRGADHLIADGAGGVGAEEAIGAGAGPKTSAPACSITAAARPSALAICHTRVSSGPETMTAAIRP